MAGMVISHGDDLMPDIPAFPSGAHDRRAADGTGQNHGRSDMLGDDSVNFPFREGRQPEESNTNALAWLGGATSQFGWNGLVWRHVHDTAVQDRFRYIRLMRPWLSEMAGRGKVDCDGISYGSERPTCLEAQAAAAEIDDEAQQ